EDIIILVFNVVCSIAADLANINIPSTDIGLNGCELYKFKINSVIAESSLGKKIISLSRNSLFELKNGYRLLNNKFLINHGPKYLIKEDLRIKVNQESKDLKSGEELDLSHLAVGEYSISIFKAHKFTIEICNNQINDFIEKSGKGWNLGEYKPCQQPFDMFGLFMEELFVDNSTSSFIDVIVKQNKIKTNNQILKSLSRLN
ncbi:MAG: hypothetical protein L3J52_02065, partial [Proteobacteria bacterium]|nr:hypothetical protein [Pseudomonadota bacterium]